MRIMPVIESPNEREAFFSLGGLKIFFISMTSQKKSKERRMSLRIPENILVCEGCLPVSTEVWTMHPVIEDVITIKEIQ